VGVRKLGQRLGFAQEAVASPLIAADAPAHQLDGDAALEQLVVAAEDDAHRPLADAAQDDVSPEPQRAHVGFAAGCGRRVVVPGLVDHGNERAYMRSFVAGSQATIAASISAVVSVW